MGKSNAGDFLSGLALSLTAIGLAAAATLPEEEFETPTRTRKNRHRKNKSAPKRSPWDSWGHIDGTAPPDNISNDALLLRRIRSTYVDSERVKLVRDFPGSIRPEAAITICKAFYVHASRRNAAQRILNENQPFREWRWRFVSLFAENFGSYEASKLNARLSEF
jgi:hypothetical protein